MSKLSKTDWLDHGLRSLSENGFTSLKADVLAKSLGVSRGSFYHHFTDLSDFHQSLLDHWLEISSMVVVADLESGGYAPADKVRTLIELAATKAGRLEQAIRAWAFSDPDVDKVVVEVDRARLAYIEQILGELGLEPEVAQRRALVLYLSNVGYSFLGYALEPDRRLEALEDLIEYASS